MTGRNRPNGVKRLDREEGLGEVKGSAERRSSPKTRISVESRGSLE